MQTETREEESSESASPLDHEYDGIREYDNPLPGWWVSIFWGSFFFAAGYLLWFHVLPNGRSVAASYTEDMAAFREEVAKRQLGEKVSESGLKTLMADAAMMKDAEVVFNQRCVPCHAEGGRGKIGPNLTDGYWIHGSGSLMEIYGVVADGVPAKGMPTWSRQLKPIELGKVVAYVGTLKNKNLPGKAPEGRATDAPAGTGRTGG